VTSVSNNIQWVPIVAVSLALMLAAALTLWVVKQDELGTPWVRDVIVAVLIALLLSAGGAVWVEYQVPGMWPPWFGAGGAGRQVIAVPVCCHMRAAMPANTMTAPGLS
jgi:hypothetical protein